MFFIIIIGIFVQTLHRQDMGIVESREVGISPSAHLPCNQESFMEDILTKETRVQQMQSDKLQDVQKEPLITGEGTNNSQK